MDLYLVMYESNKQSKSFYFPQSWKKGDNLLFSCVAPKN